MKIIGITRGERLLSAACLLGCAVAIVHIAISGTLSVSLPDARIDDWKLTHWVFTYEFGFTRRAFLGTLLSWLDTEAHVTAAWIAAYCANVLLTILLIALCLRQYLVTREDGFLLFFLVAVTHSGTIQHYVYDVGRFDQFIVILTIVAMFAINRLRSAGIFVVVTTAGIGMLLIHEAALLAAIPLIYVCWLFKAGHQGWSRRPWILSAVVILATFYIVQVTGGAALDWEPHVQLLTDRYGTFVRGDSVAVLHREIDGSVAFAFRQYETGELLAEHTLLFIAILPTLCLVILALRSVWARDAEARFATLLLASAFSPLMLYMIGIDYGRWWAFALTNFFAAIAFIAWERPRFAFNLQRTFAGHKMLVLLILASSLVFGPMGITSAFSRFESVLLAALDRATFDATARNLAAVLGREWPGDASTVVVPRTARDVPVVANGPE